MCVGSALTLGLFEPGTGTALCVPGCGTAETPWFWLMLTFLSSLGCLLEAPWPSRLLKKACSLETLCGWVVNYRAGWTRLLKLCPLDPATAAISASNYIKLKLTSKKASQFDSSKLLPGAVSWSPKSLLNTLISLALGRLLNESLTLRRMILMKACLTRSANAGFSMIPAKDTLTSSYTPNFNCLRGDSEN